MYVNSLISLEENMPTYGIDGKRVNGHVTISTPGIIRCYVQNLKSLDNKQLVLYVFSSQAEKGVRIGTLASPQEKKETKWQVNENSIMGSGIRAKDIDAVAVVKEGDSMRNTDTILSGFACNKYPISTILQALLAEYYKAEGTAAGSQVPPAPTASAGQVTVPQNGTMEMPPMPENEEVQIPEYVSDIPEPEPDEEIQIPEYISEIPEPELDEEIQVPEYISDIPEPEPDEEIQVPDYISDIPMLEVDEEIEMPLDMQFMDEMQDIEEIEIETDNNWDNNNSGNNNNNWNNNDDNNNNNWNNNNDNYNNNDYNNNNNWNNNSNNYNSDNNGDSQDNATMPGSVMERVLRETYVKQQYYNKSLQEAESSQAAKLNHQNDQRVSLSSGQAQEETPEEINYLEEIEKRLKDIQARLIVSDSLQESISKFQKSERADNMGSSEASQERSFDSSIQDIINKIAEFNHSVSPNKNREQSFGADDKLKTLYNNAPKVQPFDYKSDEIEWAQISLSDLAGITALPRNWATQPFVTFSYYKYNEIILGKAKAEESYYVGIPDIYHPDRKNILQYDTNVERFACRKNIEPSIGEYGYWLVRL